MDYPVWLETALGVRFPPDGGRLTIAGRDFVMRSGIPRAVAGLSDTQEQTQQVFGFIWDSRDRFAGDQQLEFLTTWYREMYGDVGAAPWWSQYGECPLLLDAGCGAGLSAVGTFGDRLRDVRYLGLDVSTAVEAAAERMQMDLKHLQKVDYEIDFKPGTRRSRGARFTYTFDDDVTRAVTFTPLIDFQMRGIGYTHPTFKHGAYHGPGLVVGAIAESQAAGVEPDIWKIEGIDSSETCAEIAALVKRDGRDNVGCVVLGRGADDAAVEAWLRAGAKVPGYLGFAIGRSIFNESVKGVASGTMDRDTATAIISRKYRHFIDVYEGRA